MASAVQKTLTSKTDFTETMIRRSIFQLVVLILAAIYSSECPAQPGIKELPIVEKPRERSSSERVTIRTTPTQTSKGVLAVVLTPIINGQVIIKDVAGRVLEKRDSGETGQAEFLLQRGKIYQVEVNSPGYLSTSGKSKALKATEILRLRLVPQFATLKLRDLPVGAQIFIDEERRAAIGQTGAATISEIKPGSHSLRISHPEYNDYTDTLKELEAGFEVTYPRIPLRRVAKLTVQGLAGASVMVDGAFQGRIESNGQVQFDYELDRASERTIMVELIGYQTWSKRELLTPGPRTLMVSLDPVVTSAGVTDFFETLSLWHSPTTWKVAAEGNNRRLQVKGELLGTLADKTYRDFRGNFTVWLEDGKGATWAVRADKEGRNYYLFHLAGPKSTSHTPKRFYTYLVKDGGQPVEVSTPVPVLVDLTQPGSYTISVTVESHTIRHSIVGNHKVEESDLGIWTDTTTSKDRFLYGSFGFRSLSGEIFQVDDLNLEPVKER